jgi:hypothetical protein
MLAIDRLRLNLPIEFAGRAEHIGRLVAEELAQYMFQELAWLDHIAVPAVVVSLELSDRQVAAKIARAVIGHLTNRHHSLSDLARGRSHA